MYYLDQIGWIQWKRSLFQSCTEEMDYLTKKTLDKDMNSNSVPKRNLKQIKNVSYGTKTKREN